MSPADASSWTDTPPFGKYLGIETISAQGGISETSLEWRVEITNRKGDIHGGALSSLLDFTISLALRSKIEDFKGLSTINQSINYIAPASSTVRAHGRTLKVGRSMAWAEGSVNGPDGELIASATSVFRIIR